MALKTSIMLPALALGLLFAVGIYGIVIRTGPPSAALAEKYPRSLQSSSTVSVLPTLPPRQLPPPPPPPPLPIAVSLDQLYPLAKQFVSTATTTDLVATCHRLGNPQLRGNTFLGHKIKRTHRINTDSAKKLLDLLTHPAGFSDGDIGGITDETIGIELTAHGSSLRFAYNNGHLYFTPAFHSGPFVICSGTTCDAWQSLARCSR